MIDFLFFVSYSCVADAVFRACVSVCVWTNKEQKLHFLLQGHGGTLWF